MNAFFRKGRTYRLKPKTIFSDKCEGRSFKYVGFKNGTYLFRGMNKQGIEVLQVMGRQDLDSVEPILQGRQSKHTQRIPV